ncbi:MAG: hypothetical protein SFZ02_06135 [bacterium]|nr:hypothetical protein [bacterium]
MKFAIRLTLLAIFALAISVGLVSAQEVTGFFVQASTSFTFEEADDAYTLTLDGVAGVTTLALSDATTAAFSTGDLVSDWMISDVAVPAVIRFQMGNPQDTDGSNPLRDYTITGELKPTADFAEGVVVYSLTVTSLSISELTGSVSDVAVVQIEDVDKTFEALFEDGVFASDDEVDGISVVIGVNADFINALTEARLTRAEGSRPSGVTAPCIPNVTCLPK